MAETAPTLPFRTTLPSRRGSKADMVVRSVSGFGKCCVRAATNEVPRCSMYTRRRVVPWNSIVGPCHVWRCQTLGAPGRRRPARTISFAAHVSPPRGAFCDDATNGVGRNWQTCLGGSRLAVFGRRAFRNVALATLGCPRERCSRWVLTAKAGPGGSAARARRDLPCVQSIPSSLGRHHQATPARRLALRAG
jgi:hypothetical protein